jgi:two-component system chemotaxis response regulator CheY
MGEQKTILVVDDSGVVRQLNSLTLQRNGFRVVEAINGRHALEILAHARFDLVVTDINMPEMDGIELIRNIRASKEHRFLPIVVVSTVSQKPRVQEGMTAGASGWIFKPFMAQHLLDTIGKFLH